MEKSVHVLSAELLVAAGGLDWALEALERELARGVSIDEGEAAANLYAELYTRRLRRDQDPSRN